MLFLTVFIEDLVERPAAILDMMMTFSGVTFSRSSMLVAIPDFISSLKRNLAFSAVPLLPHSSNPADNVIAINDKSEQLLRIPNELLGVCVSAILDEIRSTDGLTRWPCNSFRNIEPYGKAKVVQSSESLSIEGKLLMSSSMLAANCSSPFVKCSVSYDRAGG